MPCRDYETENWGETSSVRELKLKEQADRLARIACRAMEALEKDGRADFLLLENDEVREWWTAHKEADRKERARVAEAQRREAVKQEALNKLSDEEKELLGLKKPKSNSKVARAVPIEVMEDEDEDTTDFKTFFKQIKVR